MTRTMGIVDRCQDVGQSRSTTSRAMRLAMDAGMQARLGTMAAASMHCQGIVAVVAEVIKVAAADMRVAADVTRRMS